MRITSSAIFVTLSVFASIASTSCENKATTRSAEFNGTEDQDSSLGAPVNAFDVLKASGRFSGTVKVGQTILGDDTRKVGLLLESLPENKGYVAVTIQYTNFFKDDLVENLKKGIDRVVERVGIYHAVPKQGDSSKFVLVPLRVKDGVLQETEAESLQAGGLSELSVSLIDRSTGLGQLGEDLGINEKRYSAKISKAEKNGEPLEVNFARVSGKHDLPTSTWDRAEFIADKWEASYVFGKLLATTTGTNGAGERKLNISDTSRFKGEYTVEEVQYVTRAGKSVAIEGLYTYKPTTPRDSNPLESRVGLFIDVVNQKNIGFKTRELFLLDSSNSGLISEKNPDGFVMYFQHDFITLSLPKN